MDEFASIRHWTAGRQQQAWQQQRGVVMGIGDDTAVVDAAYAEDGVASPKRLLLAVDTMVETVHFKQSTMRDEDVGYKALATNISDIVAMGGVPLHALVSVSVPPTYTSERMRRLYDGLYECAERYGVAVVGGDTTSAPGQLVVAVTLTGTVEAGRELRRSGAQPGDAVFVTGAAGMSAAGLHVLLAHEQQSGELLQPKDFSQTREAQLVQAHQRPEPSVRAGRLLLERGTCRSLNDVSDGLASEAWEIAEASGLRLVLSEALLPRSGSMAAYASSVGIDPLEWMLYGGEDYVLLGTMDREDVEPMRAAFHQEGIPFFIIGETEAGEPAVTLISSNQSYGDALGSAQSGRRVELQKRGYNHF
ncbi:thiamine-phosphate kinase [Paenibacillus sinopodophylli]|uniref:thiamine-phosphate kinase n=1 Tax=Paenibacillus sinopodophylli TaxID=1837342 RepID=UPI00110CE6D8|nr:thiamine-phosphate kinase [Paenibacillus sinopodophylli]